VIQMNESEAERLDPARAAELARVLDLQSRWENMRADVGDSSAHLQSLQKAFEAYRASLAVYVSHHRSEQAPDLSPSGPQRLAAWCRSVRTVFRRAAEGAECPVHIVAKARRMADRIAARVGAELPRREPPPTNMVGAIQQLDTLVVWCDGLSGLRSPRPIEGGGSYEVGASGPRADGPTGPSLLQ
jgi:hypothetical protein